MTTKVVHEETTHCDCCGKEIVGEKMMLTDTASAWAQHPKASKPWMADLCLPCFKKITALATTALTKEQEKVSK